MLHDPWKALICYVVMWAFPGTATKQTPNIDIHIAAQCRCREQQAEGRRSLAALGGGGFFTGGGGGGRLGGGPA